VRGFLIDTSVLSVLAPGRPEPPPAYVEWGRQRHDRLFVPTVVLLEIEQGIRKLERIGATRRATALEHWVNEIHASFGDNIVDLDRRSAIRAGALADQLLASGRHPGLVDVLIAATAMVNGFAILSRNVKHFELTGVPTFDPLSTDFVSLVN
jgi:predicted nucleic acid-binding protein